MLRRVSLAVISGGAGAGFAALAPLITTPVMLAYLGDYRYGLWMMLISVTALIGLSDFGITNGITTELSRTGHNAAARRPLISNAYAILAMVSCILIGALGLTFVGLRLSASTGADHAFALMMVAVLTPMMVSVPLGFVVRLLYIDLRGIEAGMAPGLSAALSVAVAFGGVAVALDRYVLVFLFLSTVPVTYLILTIRYFRRHPEQFPVARDWSSETARRILYSGRHFVMLSLLVVLCNRLDYLIVAHFVGVIDLVSYAIADRVIGIANAAVTVLGASLWPVFAQKIQDGDFAWIKATILKVMLAIVVLYAAFTVALLVAYDDVLRLWLGQARDTSPIVLICLSLTSMTIALTAPYFAVANSLGVVKKQMAAYLALLAIGLPLKCIAGTTFGVPGIAAGALLSWALVMLPAIMMIAMRELKLVAASHKASA